MREAGSGAGTTQRYAEMVPLFRRRRGGQGWRGDVTEDNNDVPTVQEQATMQEKVVVASLDLLGGLIHGFCFFTLLIQANKK